MHQRSDGTARRLPPPNPNFTGRAGLSATLDDAPPVLTLRGMGGVGKTQLALAHAHRVAADFDVVWWVPAEQATLIPDRLSDPGRALGLPREDDAVAMATVVLASLHGRRSLLVFDNADDPAAVREYLPLLERALAIVEVAYGREHPVVVEALSASYEVLNAVSPDGARPVLRRLLETAEAIYGAADPRFRTLLSKYAVG